MFVLLFMTLEYLLVLENFFQKFCNSPTKRRLKYSIFSNIEQREITQKRRGLGPPNVPPTLGLWYHTIRELGFILWYVVCSWWLWVCISSIRTMSKCKNSGNRLPPLLNGDSEKKLFCDWWNIYLQLLVVIYLWITSFHLFECLPILQWKTIEQEVCSTKIGYTNTLSLGTNNSKKKLRGEFEYHTSSKKDSSTFTVVGCNGNRVHKAAKKGSGTDVFLWILRNF